MLSAEIRWLIRRALPFRGLFAIRLSTVVLTSLLGLLDPLILKWVIDEILPWRKADMLVVAAGAFFAIFLFRFSFATLSHLIDAYTAQRLMFDIRRELLRHLQQLSADFYLRSPRGDLLHRLGQDVDQICELGAHTVASLVRVVVLTMLTAAIMLALNWQLTLFVLLLVPWMLLLRRYSQPRLKRASDRFQAASARRASFFEGHLATMTQVQLLNRAAGERRIHARLGRRVIDAAVRRKTVELGFAFSSQLILVAASAVVLGLGGLQVLRGALTIGGLVAFYSYLSRIFEPLEVVVATYSDLQRANASIRRVMEVLETPPTIVDPPHPAAFAATGPVAVTLRGVSFGYRPGKNVLDGLALDVRPGEKVALVGESGSGKSTVARLLTRLYDAREGHVLLDGTPVQKLRLRDLRSRVALVPQDPVLFDGSLKDNLLYAAPKAGEQELRRVLDMAQLTRTLDELPDGLLEEVGARGDRLSGGQRQRVAIARAVLQDPRLLILDEATSALDGFTEYRLLRALSEAVRDRTVLLIAHRLSAIRWADRIVVLVAGRVVADGTHHELLSGCDVYGRLCEKQLQKEPFGGPRRAGPEPLRQEVAI